GILLIVVMMVIPMPPALLDVLLAFNISLSLLTLLVTLNVNHALEFSVFPSLLLVAPPFRLALNISSTRLILPHGYAAQRIQPFRAFGRALGGQHQSQPDDPPGHHERQERFGVLCLPQPALGGHPLPAGAQPLLDPPQPPPRVRGSGDPGLRPVRGGRQLRRR